MKLMKETCLTVWQISDKNGALWMMLLFSGFKNDIILRMQINIDNIATNVRSIELQTSLRFFRILKEYKCNQEWRIGRQLLLVCHAGVNALSAIVANVDAKNFAVPPEFGFHLLAFNI